MIFLQQSISLLYQFFLHTERVDRLLAGRSSGSSTRRRTTGSTTAPTPSTWTATTAAS